MHESNTYKVISLAWIWLRKYRVKEQDSIPINSKLTFDFVILSITLLTSLCLS